LSLISCSRSTVMSALAAMRLPTAESTSHGPSSIFMSTPIRTGPEFHKFVMLCSHCCLSWFMKEIKASSFLKLFRLGSFSKSG